MLSLIAFAAMAVTQAPLGGSQITSLLATSSTSAPTVKAGKYQVTLRLPNEGLFAGEETDVEFRVADTTQKDPVEIGFKGVANVTAKGVVTMPSMPGMPEARPEIHREGVPGDYGVVLYFPHGGEYQINLTLTPPKAKPFKVNFKLQVRDERPANSKNAQPYRLAVVNWPQHAMAKKQQILKMRVIDSKTGKTQTNFDIAHEKRFHLLIASKDLNWFVHEHPTMSKDGTWSIHQTFPAGGTYWIYGDVAPSGKGSQILITSVNVHGPKPTWNTKLILSRTAQSGGLRGVLATENPIPLGKMTTLRVKLFDAKSGRPAGDTKPWLGAAGHMMIFHQDGKTVVHSHPNEDKTNQLLVKKGVVQFSGRFPKPGIYKVYAQFDWHGAVRTLGFAIAVKTSNR